MPHPDPVFDRRVLDALARTQDLPSMPAVAVEVLRVAQDEQAGSGELASVVSLDPALAVKLLKVANSPLFSGKSEITTLQRACTQLGFKTVKLMALSFALLDSLSRPDVEGFDYDEYWKRSVVRGVSAKLLAGAVAPTLVDEAFLTGLFSRIGQLLLASCLPEEYRRVLAASAGNWPSPELERGMLGYSSNELGGALLRSWNLPPLIYGAVLSAQNPSEVAETFPAGTKELARILSLAAFCEELLCGLTKSQALVELHLSAESYFALEPERLEKLLSQVDRRTTEIAQVLSVKIRDDLDMAAVLREAQQEVFRETLSLLHDAVVNEQRAARLEVERSQLLLSAQTDPATGLATRSAFWQALARCLSEADGDTHPPQVSLLKIHVDHFNAVAEEHGHAVGEQLLQLVTRMVRGRIRDTDLATRYGVDEFAVLMPRTTPSGLQKVAERIRSAIEKQPLSVDEKEVSVTVSVGGVHAGVFDSEVNPEAFLDTADRHLLNAKQRGGNCCDFATGVHMDASGRPAQVRVRLKLPRFARLLAQRFEALRPAPTKSDE